MRTDATEEGALGDTAGLGRRRIPGALGPLDEVLAWMRGAGGVEAGDAREGACTARSAPLVPARSHTR